MKVTSEEFTKLVGPGGERFTSEGEWRVPEVGEWRVKIEGDGAHLTEEWEMFGDIPRLVLTRAKTAREWLSELPDGWREEALAHPGERINDFVPTMRDALVGGITNWGYTPSKERGWCAVFDAILCNTPLPLHPSKAEPKTAREWLEELPDGWREEALAHCKKPDDVVDSLERAILLSVNWVNSNSGVYAWDEVALAIKDGKRPLPPHPSKAKPKVERLEVFERNGWLWAGDLSLDCWIGRADFRGYVYQVNGVDLVRNFTLGWLDWSGGIPVLRDQPTGPECHSRCPSFVVVQR